MALPLRSVLVAAFACCAFPAFGAELSSTTVTTTRYNHDGHVETKYYDPLVESLPSLTGKCVAITGTTSGLGYWAAVATAKKGASCLIMLNRPSIRAVNAEMYVKSYAASNVQIFTVHCDLLNYTSVRAAAPIVNQIASKFGGLDVLMLNAGIMTQPDNRTTDGLDIMMETDTLSHFLLTKLLMPSLKQAAAARKEVRIVIQSSLARGGGNLSMLQAPLSHVMQGGGPFDAKYYMKSAPGTLGGNGGAGYRERYHQSKLANLLFALAMHSKFTRASEFSQFKALASAPGFARTHLKIPHWGTMAKSVLHDGICLSAPDGSCPMLTAMYMPSSKSGDFYEPSGLAIGPPLRVIAEGTVVEPSQFPRWIAGIRDAEFCTNANLEAMWAAAEAGIGETFVIGPAGMDVVV